MGGSSGASSRACGRTSRSSGSGAAVRTRSTVSSKPGLSVRNCTRATRTRSISSRFDRRTRSSSGGARHEASGRGPPPGGEEAAREAADELRLLLHGADMVFITCGLGGGTGTGGAPVVAQLAKEAGALTIAVCTFPFRAEGAIRAENAEYGLEKLRAFADTGVVIPNDKLLEIVPRLALNAAFRVADDVLMRGIKGITEVITRPGLVNLDFNDIKTIMKGGGVAMIGLGESDSDNRAEEAIEEAINSPLIDVDISAATGALVNVTGGDEPGSVTTGD